MNRDATMRYALRTVAIAIALGGVVDPAIASQRSEKPEIAVVAVARARDSSLAAQVGRALQKKFTVIPARFARASATVLVGNTVPSDDAELASPVFAVSSDGAGAHIAVDAVRAPSQAPLDARIPVSVTTHVQGARGRDFDISLKAGDLVIDHVTRRVASDDDRSSTSLSYLPTAAGAIPLRVVARISGAPDSASADLLVDVRDTRWPVLFYDPRPSWMSTFVRRAVERDRRFVVTSRVVTSRNVSTDAGDPPARLDDLAGVSRFATIVVGAPDALTDADVTGLDAFLRRRGGRVVLLLDSPAAGPYQRLIGVSNWVAKSENPPVGIVSAGADSLVLRAAEVASPGAMPAGATPTAWVRDSLAGRPVIWRSSVGAGAIVVSGALDAWRYRDPASSSFERFWQMVIADEANAAPPALSVQLSTSVLQPGERVEVTVTSRDAALRESSRGPVEASVGAAIDSGGQRQNIVLSPSGNIGEFHGPFRAPSAPGTYRIIATASGAIADVPVVVATTASLPKPDHDDLLPAWLASRGGRTIPASHLNELPAVLTGALRPSPRSEIWHPMRSAWWMLPFVLALSAEWWMRRRRGLA